VQVWTTPEWRHSPHRGRNGCCRYAHGQAGPPNEVADVRIVPTPHVIKARRAIAPHRHQAAPRTGLGASAQDVQRPLETIKFPLGYHAILQGAYVELQSTRKSASLRDSRVGGDLCALALVRSEAGGSQPLSFLTCHLPWSAACWARLPWRHHHLGVSRGLLSSWGSPRGTASMMINHFQHSTL